MKTVWLCVTVMVVLSINSLVFASEIPVQKTKQGSYVIAKDHEHKPMKKSESRCS